MTEKCDCYSHRTEPERVNRILNEQYKFNLQCITANNNLTHKITERENKIASYEVQLNELRE
jgi:hypothetical protein